MSNDQMTVEEYRRKMNLPPVGKKVVPEKPSKYKSVKTVVGGITFDSAKEARYYQNLLTMQRGGMVTKIERQVAYPYSALYTRPDQTDPDTWNSFTKKGKYIADFVITYADGHVEVVDVKGLVLPEFKRKKKIIEALYGITIMIA